MKTHADNQSDLGRIYNPATEFFLRGDYDRALDLFKNIYWRRGGGLWRLGWLGAHGRA
jgi:hypothetical protein